MTSAVARRYARALFAICDEEGVDPETIAAELDVLAGGLGGDAAAFLGGALDTPTRTGIAEALVSKLPLSTHVGNLVRLCADNDRLGDLGDIAAAFRRLADDRAKRVRARVVSARDLGDDDLDRIRAVFENATGRTVLTAVEVEPELLGGVLVEIGGRVYDGTARTQLARLRATLSG